MYQKKLLWAILVSGIFSVALVNCSGGDSGPEGVVKKYLTYAKSGNYGKVSQCYAKSVTEQPGAKEKLSGMTKQSIESKDGVKSFEITGSEIDGDKAQVSYTVEYGNGDTDKSNVNCVKEEGEWYLSVN